MEIVIKVYEDEGDGDNYRYTTERSDSDYGGICHPVHFCHGRHEGKSDAVSKEEDFDGIDDERSAMKIIPNKGREEYVERFVALGRLQNGEFPFVVKGRENEDNN